MEGPVGVYRGTHKIVRVLQGEEDYEWIMNYGWLVGARQSPVRRGCVLEATRQASLTGGLVALESMVGMSLNSKEDDSSPTVSPHLRGAEARYVMALKHM
ncbi:unnamed protein product [Pleuronectes platessa]|uniref:Uncharacterized protein n=1 Tax=Pleuronectes platessa TaxID=8262 RepID=A0A9N7YVQ4_PLEPL|nr:unnamed protein product [Pleuronectes platessa]